MWVAAGNPGTFENAAKMGLGVLCFGISNPEALKPLIDVYKTNIGDADPVGDFVNDNIMVTTQMLCLEDGQKAKEIATRMTTGYHTPASSGTSTPSRSPRASRPGPSSSPNRRWTRSSSRSSRGSWPSARPTRSRRAWPSYEATGADQLVFGMLSTTMPIDIAVEAVETFGRHLIPAFDKDPVHRTTAQREAQVSPQPA